MIGVHVKLNLPKICQQMIVAAIATLFFMPVQASYQNSTQLGLKKEKQSIRLTNNLSYGMSSDALDNSDQKVFNHGVSYNGTLNFKDDFYTTFGVAATYTSVDTSITEQDNGAFQLTDLFASIGTNGFSLYKGDRDSINVYNNFGNVFPLSETSRNEGYKSVPSVSTDIAYQRGPLGIVLTGQYSHVINSYDVNTEGLYNLRSSSVARLTARYNQKIFKSLFRFQYFYSLGVAEYIDGNRLGSSGNGFSISTLINKNIWVGASTTNVSFIDEQYVDVWFYDPYRRFYNLRLGVTF